ncbi:MAG: CRISPR-associated protein [Candidatus Bathyarchaeota archaeon BA1]|nr:MAG: CRISPR-associated protein [Candidatus Bathyarchaeota archaeon BA1]
MLRHSLKEYLEDQDVQVAEPIEIQGLHGPETFQRGLANLVREIARILTHHKDVRICATGGFKPEVALASVLGFIAKVPVYYIHESFRQEIHLPALPIDWKLDVKRHGKAIKAIVTAGERGIEKNQFIENFGRETYEELRNNWLIEEKGNRCAATDISRAILEAMLKLSKRKYARSALCYHSKT